MATALKLRTDIKKLKDALKVKKIPANIKSKLESQLKKSQDELAALKKGKKTPTSRSAVKGTQTALSRLKSLIKKPKYGVYADGQTKDLEEDAVQGAFPKGRRVSKGLKSNQFGSAKENKGKVYYEYRSNRLDVKQPKKKQTYPKLEKGGMMAKGGYVAYADGDYDKEIGRFSGLAGAKKFALSNQKKYDTITFEDVYGDSIVVSKDDTIKDIDYLFSPMMADGGSVKKKIIADGGMMAKGGMIEHGLRTGDKILGGKAIGTTIRVRNENFNEDARIDLETGERTLLQFDSKSKKWIEKKASGGMMAAFDFNSEGNFAAEIDGKKYEIIYRDDKSQMYDLFEDGKKIKSSRAVRDLMNFADGGMMAKGGKLSLSEFAERYDDNEDNNMHSENVVLLAENFGTKQDILDAKTILAKHEAIGSLPYYLMQERDALSNRLYAKYQEAAKKKESDGGMMADGGVVYTYEKIKNYPTFDTEEEAKKFIKLGKPFLRKQLRDGEIVLVHNGKEYFLANVNQEKKMAHGGEIKKGDMVKVDNPYWHAAMGTDKPVVRKVTMVTAEDVFFKDGSTSRLKYVTKMEAGGVMAEA